MEASLNGPLGRTALGQGTLKIGRAPDNTLVINDPQASAHHVEVAPALSGNGYQVTDLQSTNGTFVNEQRLTAHVPHPLNSGEVIRIGSLRFIYEATSDYAPTVLASNPHHEITPPPVQQPVVLPSPQPPLYPPQAAPYPPQVTPYPPYASPQAVGGYGVPAQPVAPFPPGQAIPQPLYASPQPAYPLQQPAYPLQQPAYPLQQPGIHGQPGYQPRKKGRAGLWIMLVILLLIVAGGGALGYVYLNRSTPEKTLQAYCTALVNNDSQGAYNTLSTAAQAQTSLSDISKSLATLKLLGGVTSCTYNNVVVNGNTATATLSLTVAGKTTSGPGSLILENNQWKIAPSKT